LDSCKCCNKKILILAANRSYFGLRKHLKFPDHLKKEEEEKVALLYKTAIRKTEIYGAQRCTLSQWNEQNLVMFERKVLRMIDGTIQDVGVWINFEIYALYK
jgi:hypothetical protein